MTPPGRVFLVPSGYNFRAVLAFCRALRLARLPVAVVACTNQDPIFRTRYGRDVVFVRPSHALEPGQFAAAIAAARQRTGAARCVLAPTSEFLVRWALRHRDALRAAGCDLPLPGEEAYLRVTEKAAMTSFCRERGFAVPIEFDHAVADQVPCVAKPRRNISAHGCSLSPWLLRSAADFNRFKAETNPGDFFFQEWVDGRSFYLFFHLPKAGRATSYSQENLAQQPGGKSMLLARGADLHRTGEARRWEELLRAAGFHGLVMVELRQRGTDYVFIEANPRLWGPLQLCVDGCPALLMNYLAEHTGHLPVPSAFEPSSAAPHYLWSSGVTAASSTAWHSRTPRFGWWHLLRHLGSDVYLRTDSWREFLREHRVRRQALVPAPIRPAAMLPRPNLPVAQ